MKITDIPVIFICPDSDEKYSERKTHTINILSNLGFKNVSMHKSGTEKYPLCLSIAYSTILKNNLNDDPLIILEDDNEISEWFQDEIDYPKNTDAFYLGFSKCGGSRTDNVDNGDSIIEFIGPKHIRILNMLSGHAILHVSKRFKQEIINLFDHYITNNIPYYNDVLISRIQNKFNVYGYYFPFFYQSAGLGNNPHVEKMTNFCYKNDTLIVTAYYLTSKCKHSVEEYMYWANLFFTCVKVPIVCFCSIDMVEKLSHFASDNVTFIVKSLNEWDMFSETQMKIWDDFYKIDPEQSYHSPQLYGIWAAKQEFVRYAISKFSFNNYVWCDIGCFRNHRDGSFKYTNKYILPNKITCLSLYDVIGGGVLAGDKNAWNMFSNLYLEELARNPHGKDQIIYKRILNDSNSNIIKANDSYGDPWFYLTYLFSFIKESF
jgi:hypothetical protein